MKKVVAIGGGTGTFVVLSGIKHDPYDISAVVSMTDSGGSTGRLRDQYGVVPPGDIRQCLVALSEASDLWRRLFVYRFGRGDLIGHNFGNIFLTALEKVTPNYQEVIDTASYILQIKGKVIPVTFDNVHLCAQYEDGETLEREDVIDKATEKSHRITRAFLKPKAKGNYRAVHAIKNADYIIICPGDLYTSLIPNFLPIGISRAMQSSKAHIIMIMNLMTKRGQTSNYRASDHIRDIEHYMGKKVDIVLLNNAPVKKDIISYYTSHGEHLVEDDLDLLSKVKIMRRDLLAQDVYKTTQADKLVRSIQRHDPEKVAKTLRSIIMK